MLPDTPTPDSSPNGASYRFGLFALDTRDGRLAKQGKVVRLQEQPFQVLLALVERAGEVVSREELRQRLWSGDTFVDFDKSLGVAITKLRDALGDEAGNPTFIETLPRRGYRFIAPVERRSETIFAAPAPFAAPAVTELRAVAASAEGKKRNWVCLLYTSRCV